MKDVKKIIVTGVKQIAKFDDGKIIYQGNMTGHPRKQDGEQLFSIAKEEKGKKYMEVNLGPATRYGTELYELEIK